jgi:hypothetical protein
MIGVIRAVSHLWTNPLSACVMGSLIGISTFLLTSYLLHSVELRDTFAAINRKLRKATTI